MESAQKLSMGLLTTSRKHDSVFSRHAIEYCLQEAGITTEVFETRKFVVKVFQAFPELLVKKD